MERLFSSAGARTNARGKERNVSHQVARDYKPDLVPRTHSSNTNQW